MAGEGDDGDGDLDAGGGGEWDWESDDGRTDPALPGGTLKSEGDAEWFEGERPS